MNIKGLHKTSLIDFPKTICTVLFTGGCNLRCKYCYNSELACDDRKLEVWSNKRAFEFLEKRRAIIEGITISGGEPLLRPNIFEFLKEVKKLKLKVKLDTNGFYPSVLSKLLNNNLIDYLSIDIKTSIEKYPDLTDSNNLNFANLLETINLAKQSDIDYELRTTCIPGYVTLDDLTMIKDFVGNVKNYYLQQFINEHTLSDEFLKITPYKQETLYEFRDYILTFSSNCEIRGI